MGMKSGAFFLLAALMALPGCKTTEGRSPTTPLPVPKPEPQSQVQQPQVQSVPPAKAPPVKATPAKAPEPPPIDVVAERQRLLETDIAFSRASEQRGAAQAFYEYLAPDALSLQGGELPIKGRDAIKIQITTNLRGVLSWTPQDAEVSSGADLGYTWGTYIFHGDADGRKDQTVFGKYLSVWKKQSDGSWKVIVDAGNESPPPDRRR